jgi:hypothetical protein
MCHHWTKACLALSCVVFTTILLRSCHKCILRTLWLKVLSSDPASVWIHSQCYATVWYCPILSGCVKTLQVPSLTHTVTTLSLQVWESSKWPPWSSGSLAPACVVLHLFSSKLPLNSQGCAFPYFLRHEWVPLPVSHLDTNVPPFTLSYCPVSSILSFTRANTMFYTILGTTVFMTLSRVPCL